MKGTHDTQAARGVGARGSRPPRSFDLLRSSDGKKIIAGNPERSVGGGQVDRGGAAAAALTWTLVALRAATLVMEEAMQAILKSGRC